MSWRLGMSASEARGLGLDVPDKVPDHAILVADKVSVGSCEPEPNGVVKVPITMQGTWTWCEINVEIEDE